MNQLEQIEFVDKLVNSVLDEIKSQVQTYAPEDWDGVELRQFVSDSFNEVVIKGTMSRPRRIAYNNIMLRMPRPE